VPVEQSELLPQASDGIFFVAAAVYGYGAIAITGELRVSEYG
jgi:hypothetical protein